MNIITDLITVNHTKGRGGVVIDTIVLHSTYGSYWGSVNWLKNPQAQASAHYIISREGEIRKLVAEADIAWHSGNSSMNQRSIGIETTDDQKKEITQKAKEALIWLVADIKKRNAIKDIKFHRDVINTACPFLDIRKEWFSQTSPTVDPLKECLAQHSSLVKETTELKKKIEELIATEQRLKKEKDDAVRELEDKLRIEREKLVAVSKTERQKVKEEVLKFINSMS